MTTHEDPNLHPVLDHGFVRLVDTMGDDSAIVQAARVSYQKGTKTVQDDEGLIRYLMRNWHTTPFEMCEIALHVKAPIFIARQWLRHRTASPNEMSGRYSVMPSECYVPSADQIRPQSKSNKQGRGDGEIRGSMHKERAAFELEAVAAHDEYQRRLDTGMARELARINLPLSQYTEFYWKIDLHNLFHFLRLRLHPHAQYEIRVYAEAIADIVRPWVPMAWRAFEDYRLKSISLSRAEKNILATCIDKDRALILLDVMVESGEMGKREAREFRAKLLKGGG